MRNILTISFVCLALSSNAQTKSFTISGKIKGLDSKEMNILIDDKSSPNGYRRDKIPVVNESFSYTAEINDPAYMTIWPNVDRTIKKIKGGGYYPAKSSQFNCFVAPGVKIKFIGKITDFVDAYPSGDKTNEIFTRLLKSINPLQNKSVNASVRIADKIITDSVLISKTGDSIKKWDDDVLFLKMEFLKKNPSAVASIWLLSDMIIRSQLTNDEAISFFKDIDKTKLVSVPYYKDVAKRVDAISATGEGKTVPDIISTKTFDGSRFDLASLRGKYVVLDFWGTWCGPCVSGMPKMKEYRDKYKDKMEIVGVASESDNGESWKKFLTNRPMFQWPHVLSRKNEEDFILKFNVAGFPTKIIVDPNGIIVGRYVGEDDEIYKKLDEILSGTKVK